METRGMKVQRIHETISSVRRKIEGMNEQLAPLMMTVLRDEAVMQLKGVEEELENLLLSMIESEDEEIED